MSEVLSIPAGVDPAVAAATQAEFDAAISAARRNLAAAGIPDPTAPAVSHDPAAFEEQAAERAVARAREIEQWQDRWEAAVAKAFALRPALAGVLADEAVHPHTRGSLRADVEAVIAGRTAYTPERLGLACAEIERRMELARAEGKANREEVARQKQREADEARRRLEAQHQQRYPDLGVFDAASLLAECRSIGVALTVNADGRLVMSGAVDAVPSLLRQRLRATEQAVIRVITPVLV